MPIEGAAVVAKQHQIVPHQHRSFDARFIGRECAKAAFGLSVKDAFDDLLGAHVNEFQRDAGMLRLKGGDPYIFGRGGEEAEFLVDNDIDFQVVPGITSAAGCASYCGIPLTHRDYSQSVTFVTGHRKADQTLELNWPVLAAPGQTRVFYMGLHNAPTIVRELTAHGLSENCPVALVERGTTPLQHMTVTTLKDLVDTIDREDFQPPTLIIVGEVVQLADKLARPAQAGWNSALTEPAVTAGQRPA